MYKRVAVLEVNFTKPTRPLDEAAVAEWFMGAFPYHHAIYWLNKARDFCTTFHAAPLVTAPPLGWVNVYPNGHMTLFKTDEIARSVMGCKGDTRMSVPVYEHPPQPLQPLVRETVLEAVTTAFMTAYPLVGVNEAGERIVDAITDAVMALDAERAA